jgi:hypothetical protein
MSQQDPAALLAQIQYIQQTLAAHRQTLPQEVLGPESIRTPGTLARNNVADIIEHQMQNDGHRLWGLVIYRCDYESNQRWEQCLAAIHASVEQTLREWNGSDLISSMQLTVMNDEDLYAGLSPSQVREHFRQWREQAIAQEQGCAPGAADYAAPRYTYCMQIDSPALRSILDIAQAANAGERETGYVNVISAAQGHETGARPEYYEELGDENFDTGWMRVPYWNLVEFAWYWVGDVGSWYSEYRPPPKVHDR